MNRTSATIWGANAQLARDTIDFKTTRGIPGTLVFVMDHETLEDVGGRPRGSYRRDPGRVYRDFHLGAGTCMLDQWIPTNPLSMGGLGYEGGAERGVTTGAESIVCDGIDIDSPESVAEHVERFVLPGLAEQQQNLEARGEELVGACIRDEQAVQAFLGDNLLKCPYVGALPTLLYGLYGYENYFMAYALYPELMGRVFERQADVAVVQNRIYAQAIVKGGLPRLVRLDHDMTDSRGTLVDIRSLESLWFPQLARSIQPFHDAGIRLLWHCDGNIMPMVPGLIAAGIGGFQGFQYEAGVDYMKLCRMTDRDGGPLMIWAGVSVTTTLVHGTPADVCREMKWLVENGPPVGLFLAGSSSITPGTPRANVDAMLEGFRHYREIGR